MMQFIRKNVPMVMAVILFVVIAFVGTIFLVWGRGGPSGLDVDVVAWIGDSPVYQKEYDDFYNNLMDFYRNVYENLSYAEIERRFDIRKTALENVIDRRVLLLEAESLGVGVSDDEVRRKITENQAFQVDGRFDSGRYLQVTQFLNQTPEQFETAQRYDLLVNKLESIIRDGVKVTDEETLEEYRRSNEKVILGYIQVLLDPFRSKVSIEEAELDAFFQENRQNYFQPERIEVEFVRFDPERLSKDAELSDEEIETYYQENLNDFETPRQVRARHILFRLDQDAPEEEEKDIRERAQFVLDKAREGVDFASLAQEFSQDTTGPAGGDLGYFSRDRMVPEFSEAAFSLEKGEISELVRTSFGYHLIKVEDVREAGRKSLEEVRAELVNRLKKEAGSERARDLADMLNERLYDQSLEEAAKEMGLEVEKSGYFAPDEPVPSLPVTRQVKEALLDLSMEEVSEEIIWGQNRYFFRLIGRQEGHLPELEEVRREVERDFTSEKAMEMAQEAAMGVLNKVDGGLSMDEVASAGNYQTGKTEPLARDGFAGEIALTGEDVSQIFPSSPGEVVGPVKSSRGYVVLKLLEKETIDQARFEEEMEEVRNLLWEEKSQRFFRAWIDEIKEKRGVKIETDVIGQV